MTDLSRLYYLKEFFLRFLYILSKTLDISGSYSIKICGHIGSFVLFLLMVVKTFFSTKPKWHKMLMQMERIGIHSLIIAMLTGTFAGAVLAIQLYIGFKRFGGEKFIGPVVAFSLARELGPVLTGLMVTGRAGSAIAAEIGTMRITEQIDALQTLRINIWQYLMLPRICASIFIMPFLTLFTMLSGIIGSYLVGIYGLNLNGAEFLSGIQRHLMLSDIINGLLKSAVFGLIFSWIGCYKGYHTTEGSRGVGSSTTQAVVIGSILILMANYFLTIWLFE